MTLTLLQRLTVEEFEYFADAAENSEHLLELIHGEIVEKMPTEEHAALAAQIAYLLKLHVQADKLGRVTVEPRHRVPGDDHKHRPRPSPDHQRQCTTTSRFSRRNPKSQRQTT
jgi:Uma2 family endonuclease